MTSDRLRKILVAGAAVAALSAALSEEDRRRERERHRIAVTAREGDTIVVTASRSAGVTPG